MSDVKRLLTAATPPPWIRPWADLRVRAWGDGDLFGREVTNEDLNGISKAQSNLDLAVYAVNRLPASLALEEAAAALVQARDAGADVYEARHDVEAIRSALARLRGGE